MGLMAGLIAGLIVGSLIGGFAVAVFISLTYPNWENEIYMEGYLDGERDKNKNS